jgi:hypothetical protein
MQILFPIIYSVRTAGAVCSNFVPAFATEGSRAENAKDKIPPTKTAAAVRRSLAIMS